MGGKDLAYALGTLENTQRFFFTENYLGREIKNRNLGKVYEGQELIDVRKFDTGIYFYPITQDDAKIGDGKFVIEH